MASIDLSHGTINYRVAGPAQSVLPPVVFVHGVIVNGELWSGVGDMLAQRGVRSYAPDLPLGSHTVAMNPDADQSPRGVARMIVEFLQALDLEDVTLVGNDTGGALCQFLIDTDHTRVGRLVLTNCDAFDKFPPAPFDVLVKAGSKRALLRAAVAPMRSRVIRHSAAGYGLLVAKALDADLTRRWVEPLLSNRDIRRDTAAFFSAMDKRELLDVSTRLGQFRKPVLLVWGAADRLFKLDFARRLADVFPDCRLVEVEGGKTFLPLDEPQRIADEIAVAFYPATITAG